ADQRRRRGLLVLGPVRQDLGETAGVAGERARNVDRVAHRAGLAAHAAQVREHGAPRGRDGKGAGDAERRRRVADPPRRTARGAEAREPPPKGPRVGGRGHFFMCSLAFLMRSCAALAIGPLGSTFRYASYSATAPLRSPLWPRRP